MVWQERAELLFKTEGLNNLRNAHVLIVGLGGVGSFAAEFITRAGVGKLTIVDGDVVDVTNINRQLPALHSTINRPKIEVVAERLLDINPALELIKINQFLLPEEAYAIVDKQYDYVVDCIDSVTPKFNLIVAAKRKKVKLVSCMGAGGKMQVNKVQVRDISKTEVCPLAKNIRKNLKKIGISKGIKAVYSTEIPEETSLKLTNGDKYKRSFYGTNSWMPALFGLYAAEVVVNYLLKKNPIEN